MKELEQDCRGGCVECNENNVLFPKFIYSPAPDKPICMIDKADGNTIDIYHYDDLRSVDKK
ncbi:MAG: hypothetical protein ACYSWZ_05400 [Planctomycetota bacterium]|jgi:hypothetical protein